MRNPLISLFAYILLINTCLCSSAVGQKEFGFKMPNKSKKITIPFEKYSNLIIIPVTINDFVTLKFVLDTGVETPILTEKLYADLLNFNYLREIVIDGPGIVDSVEALVANEIVLTLPGGVVGKNMNMLVLKEDYLELSNNIGENVHGIIGYDVFSRFVVEINYDDEILTLHDPQAYKKSRKSTELPIEIIKSKPYLNVSFSDQNQKKNLNVMVDTGASHAALLDYSNLDGLQIPEKRMETRLGRGIAGEIPGYVCRMDSVFIDDFFFNDVLVSAPFEGAYYNSIKRGSKVGTFGGEMLLRFNVTFDYFSKKMYLEKSPDFGKKFEFDMSGMALNVQGKLLDTLKVAYIKEGSPADKVGIRVDDVIISVNGKSLNNSKFSEIISLLRRKENYKISCKILRDGERFKKKFNLKRMI